MDRDVANEIVGVALVGAFYVASITVAGPVGAAAAVLSGEVAGSVVDRFTTRMVDRFLGAQGIQEPDLHAALRRSFSCAITNLERRWSDLEGGRSGRADTRATNVRSLFQMLREDADRVLGQEVLREVTENPNTIRLLGSGTHGITAALGSYLDSYLYGHSEQLATLLYRQLEPELAGCFAKDLK